MELFDCVPGKFLILKLYVVYSFLLSHVCMHWNTATHALLKVILHVLFPEEFWPWLNKRHCSCCLCLQIASTNNLMQNIAVEFRGWGGMVAFRHTGSFNSDYLNLQQKEKVISCSMKVHFRQSH